MAILRRRRLLSIFAMFLGMALLTTGCTKEEPKPTPTPTKTAIFSSEEAALQAAIDVYQAFSAESDKATAAGSSDLSAIENLMTDAYFDEYSTADSLTDRGWHTSGTTSFSNTELVELTQGEDWAEVNVALCRDLSSQKVLNESDEDVTDEFRTSTLVPLEVSFTWISTRESLAIDEIKIWEDSRIC